MVHLCVREHETLRITSVGKDGQFITPNQAEKIKKLTTHFPAGVISWGHQTIKFSQFCGIFQVGDLTIEILPKIYGNKAERELDRNVFLQMLYVTQHLIRTNQGMADLEIRQSHLLDVFIACFCSLLFEQTRQGLIRIYKNKESNLNLIRGRLLFSQQIKINVAHQEKLYCNYDELETNNEYNIAIKAALRILYFRTKNIWLKQQINELLLIFSEASDAVVTAKHIESLEINRLVKRYELVLKMCSWFLSGLNPDIRTGKEPALSLLFDMNRLFEEYIAISLRKAALSRGLEIRTQGPRRYLVTEETTERKMFLMKPDITLLTSQGEPCLLLDVKWKLLDSSDNKFGVSQSDMYQMLAYAHQYSCNRVVLIYPKYKDIDIERPLFKTIVGDVTIFIWMIDLTEVVKDGIQNQLNEMVANALG